MVRRLAAILIAITASTAFAADTPHAVWVKAKCAVCHGEDGAGKTPEGKRRKVPDLRSAEVQKRTDAQLTDVINAGHAKMPSFQTQMSKERVALLVLYIRSLRKQ